MKYTFDIVVSVIMLVILLPLLILTTIVLAVVWRGNPFFTQLRPGRHENFFKLIKFRTMYDHKDSEGNFLPDDKRLTPLGKFIRKTSIDELPQLINVLNGQMSLVGPRPLLIEYLPLYNKHQYRRHEVKPGITGYAQVMGRNSITWEQKFDYDVWYVDNQSLWLDCKILTLTFIKALKFEGINEEGHTTASMFEGQKVTSF